ncbi:MAG TPA: hypothetical protein VGH54_29545 [Mycobacterium sp.]|jgi:hypothetical protein|uniref:hypothetical protein n=1 Tax=Mycobacterium sp. TaxID=1785 RepID=UPI002F42C5AE
MEDFKTDNVIERDPVNAELERMRALWQSLKDDLTTRINSDHGVHAHFVAAGDMTAAAPYGGLLSANRTTLAKMREMEADGG